jgi:hypothetical protein
MDELVVKKDVVGPQLVQAVMKLLPGGSIEETLDMVRSITLNRVIEDLKPLKFATVFHLVEHIKRIGLTTADMIAVLNFVAEGDAMPVELRSAARSLLDSGLGETVFEFVSEIEEVTHSGCFCPWRNCKRNTK